MWSNRGRPIQFHFLIWKTKITVARLTWLPRSSDEGVDQVNGL